MGLLFRTMTAATLATAANAATFTSHAGSPDPGPAFGEAIAVNFDAANAAGFAWTAGQIDIAQGTSAFAAAPSENPTRYGYVSSASADNFATLSTPNLRSISFYWGSIDSYNSVDVLGPGNNILMSINGDMMPLANGDQHDPTTNRRIFIEAGFAEIITGLTFRSTGIAFEFDDIAASLLPSPPPPVVPEPQAWMMLIAGFGTIGIAIRRRSKAATTA